MTKNYNINENLTAFPYYSDNQRRIYGLYAVKDKEGKGEIVERNIIFKDNEEFILYKRQLVRIKRV